MQLQRYRRADCVDVVIVLALLVELVHLLKKRRQFVIVDKVNDVRDVLEVRQDALELLASRVPASYRQVGIVAEVVKIQTWGRPVLTARIMGR